MLPVFTKYMQNKALIVKANGVRHLHKSNGNTRDIINSIMYADGLCAAYTANLSRALASKSLHTTCYNIWKFWKDNVKYVEDPDGYQFVKSPGYLYEVGQTEGGDCKSYSVAIASCLKNAGIKYYYRFISEDSTKDYHHVYVVVPSPEGEIVIDCVLDDFNKENAYQKKRDLVPGQPVPARIGNVNSYAPPAGSFWLNEVNSYRNNIEQIKADVKQRLKNGIKFYFGSQIMRKNKALKLVDENWDALVKTSSAMMYKWWDESQAPFPSGIFNNSTPFQIQVSQVFGNISAKKEYGSALFEQLTKIGAREGDLRDLCSIGVFNLYGIPLNYMLYRCYSVIKYGQPWEPMPGVPYWDFKANQYKANGASNNDVLLLAFSLPYGGGVGRPYGSPYWAAGGWVMKNGAVMTDEDLRKWEYQNPKPNNLNLNVATVQASMALYDKWLNGNMPSLPVNADLKARAGVSGTKSARIGLADAVIIAIVGAVVAVVGVVVGILKDMGVFSGKEPSPEDIPLPPKDFSWEYATVDGCYIGSAPAECGANKAKYCANGSFTCLTEAQLNLPENQPAAGNHAPDAPGSFAWLAVAGAALLGMGFLSGNSKAA